MSACGDLAAGASLGAGPALRAVDCLANEAAASAFGRLFGSDGAGGGALLPALTILLTLYIALFAFALITGRSRLGLSALTPRMMTLGLVLTFATSWLAWQQVVWNLAIGAPDQLAAILTGAQGSATQIFADRIDMVSAAVAQAADTAGGAGGAGDQAAGAARAASTFSPEGLMWLGAMLLLLGTVGVLATARIVLAVLLAIGPVFVVLALFRGTRGLTAGWLRGVVMTALAPLFVVVAGSIMLELVVPVVASLRGENGIDARAAMALFLIAAVHCALMAMVLKVAGTMVSAWSVFGLGAAGGRDETRAAPVAQAAAPALASPAAALAATTAAAAAAPALSRTAAMVAPGMAASGAASDAAPAAAIRSTHTVRTAVGGPAPAPAPGPATPRLRTQGIGSRFAARPSSPRKMMR